MAREAADQSVLALLIGDAKTELEVVVDLGKELLDLRLADEDERLGVVVDVPDVVAAITVSGVVASEVRIHLQIPLTSPELALIKERRGNVLRVNPVAPLVRVL